MKNVKYFVLMLGCLLVVGSNIGSAQTVSVALSGVSCGTGNASSFPVGTFSVTGTSTDKLGAVGGSLTGVVNLTDLLITKALDPCSADLIRLFVSGKKIATVTLTETTPTGAGGPPHNPITITLTGAYISNYSINGAPGAKPSEVVDFLFSKVCVTTVSQNPNGSLESPQTVCYDPITRIVS